MPEVFTYSSNIGAARWRCDVGADVQQRFSDRFGLLTQAADRAARGRRRRSCRRRGRDLTTMTVAFGHGIAVTPLQVAVGDAALVNGGMLIPPTFVPRTREEADKLAARWSSRETSDTDPLPVPPQRRGGLRQATPRVPGYMVGGKTGTAEKVVNGRYSANKRAQFLPGGLPDGRSAICRPGLLIDEPQPREAGCGARRPRMNAAPVVGAVIRRSARAARRRAAGRRQRRQSRVQLKPAPDEPLGAQLIRRHSARTCMLGRSCQRRPDSRPGARAVDIGGPHRRQPRGRSPASCSPRWPAPADGARFVADAVARGAVARSWPRRDRPAIAGDVAGAPSPRDPRRALALLAARFYPRQPAHLVAVTGTSGKTSVAAFVRQILAAAGHEAASIGTLGIVTPAMDARRQPDHARPGRAPRDARPARARRRHPCSRSRPRATASTSAGSTGCARRRRLHQPGARPHGLPRRPSRPTSRPSCGCSTALLPAGGTAVIDMPTAPMPPTSRDGRAGARPGV